MKVILREKDHAGLVRMPLQLTMACDAFAGKPLQSTSTRDLVSEKCKGASPETQGGGPQPSNNNCTRCVTGRSGDKRVS